MNPHFSLEKAKEMLNKKVLVNARIIDKDNKLIRKDEYIAIIMSVDEKKGIFLKAPNGKINWFPPNTKAFNNAPIGNYKNSKTGETIEKPDYILNFEMKIEKVDKKKEIDDLSTTIIQ